MTALESRSRDFCDAFASAEPSRRFVMGIGEYAQSIATAVEIAGFVDDFTSLSSLGNTPIRRLAEVPEDALVVVASMLRPVTALRAVNDRGLRALDYFAFCRFSGLELRPVAFWPAFIVEYDRHRGRFDAIRGRLADAESVQLFDDLVTFRTQSDLDAMSRYAFDPDGQYFEDFLHLRDEGETFVDVGSFDGQTSLHFATQVPEFARIYAFEPSAENRVLVEERLGQFGQDRAVVLPYGLAAEAGTKNFDAALGSASRVATVGDSVVEMRCLDALNIESPTFIKMDIEGGEVDAIRGAQDTIRKFHPRLAIAVYHRPDDLWRIPAEVDAAGQPYDLYLRHYTEGTDETVMFFMPASSTASHTT